MTILLVYVWIISEHFVYVGISVKGELLYNAIAQKACARTATSGHTVPPMSDENNEAPSPVYRDAAGCEAQPITLNPSDEAVTEFVETVNALGVDGRWLVGGLTDFLRRQKRSGGPGMTAEERKFVIESGTMTEAELVASERSVARGSLERSAGELWLGTYQETWSANTAAQFLGWTQKEVLAAADERRIYGIPVRGRLRFPRWQFSLGSPGKLIPHLETVLPVLTEHWDWISISAFMSVRQRSLVAEGRKTPRSWLRDGGDPAAIADIIEGDKWW